MSVYALIYLFVLTLLLSLESGTKYLLEDRWLDCNIIYFILIETSNLVLFFTLQKLL